MVDMFDYITVPKLGDDPADWYRFSVPFKGATGAVRTHNEATSAATKTFAFALLPLKRRMDEYRSAAIARFQMDPCTPTASARTSGDSASSPGSAVVNDLLCWVASALRSGFAVATRLHQVFPGMGDSAGVVRNVPALARCSLIAAPL